MAGYHLSLALALSVLLAFNCKLNVKAKSIKTMAKEWKDLFRKFHATYNGMMELVFVLDQSGSVGRGNFQKEIEFMKNALSEFSVAKHRVRVSVIRFGTAAKVDIRLDSQLNKCDLFRAIANNVIYKDGLTNTNEGLKEARKQLLDSRPGAIKVVITITDGSFNKGGDPKGTATEMKNDGIRMIAMGIGNINYGKLEDIASSSDLVNKVEGFTEFKEMAEYIYGEPPEKHYEKVSPEKCNGRCSSQTGFCGCESFEGMHYECVCQPGHFRNGYACARCPLNTYKDRQSTTDSCDSCPDHMETKHTGTVYKKQCICKRGFTPIHRSGNRECKGITCDKIAINAAENLRLLKHCDNKYEDFCEFTCNEGFRTNEPLTTQCLEQGWTYPKPNCKAITCGQPPMFNGTRYPRCINNKGGGGLSTNDYGAVCSYTAKDGYRRNGDGTVECKADGKWHGNVSTTLITCPPLSKVKHSYFTQDSCQNPGIPRHYGKVCTYFCNAGYNIQGQATRQCLEDGTWSNSLSNATCKDVEYPTLTIPCPRDIYVDTTRNMPTATVNWTEPTAEDNSGIMPTKSVRKILPRNNEIQKKHLKIPHKFAIGETTVEYTFADGEGLTSSCRFTVKVKDTEPPQVDYCPPDQKVITSKLKVNVSWDNPTFSDNSGTILTEKNIPPGEMRWGKYMITYKAEDRSGNSAYCRFTVSVQPNDCPILDPPVNGAQACDTWLLGKFCTIHCNKKFEFAEKPEKMYVCGGSGKWHPFGSTPYPDCSKVYNPKKARLGLSIEQYFEGDCNDENVQKEIKNKFIAIFNTTLLSRVGGCIGNKECKVENVIVRCGKKNLTILTGSRNRRKRDTGFVIKIEFFVTASLKEPNDKVTESESKQLKDSLPGVLDVNKTIKAFAQQLNNGKEENVNVTTKPVEFSCGEGQYLKNKKKCVDCPVGTYQPQDTEDCLKCPKGYFNSEEAQLSCTRCPSEKTTHTTGAKNESYCLSPCSPGSYSASGLETCQSCPEGQYQDESAKTTCKHCPKGTTTPQRGAVDLQDCQIVCRPGSSSDTGLKPCSPCEKNTYQPKSKQKACIPCSYPKATLSVGATSEMHCVDVDECLSSPCQNDGTCLDDQGFYLCKCSPGFTGDNCEINIDECELSPCENGATCNDLINSFSCTCLPGYNGNVCEGQINECQSLPCVNGATCRDYVNNYTCDCLIGFSGRNCEVNIDDCSPNPCNHSAPCKDLVNNFNCSCPAGFAGHRCEIDIDECETTVCLNGARCTDLVNGFKCQCEPGFTGINCEIDINECASNACLNNATCFDDINSFYCACVPNFAGKRCEAAVSNNFDMDFNDASISDYLSMDPRPPFPSMEAIAIGFWMVSTDNKTFHNYGTPFSYGTRQLPKAFTLFNYGYFSLVVNGDKVVTGVKTNDGFWRHVLVTWQKINGEWKIYKDGMLAANGTNLSKGVPVPGGGTFVVGQKQNGGAEFLEREIFRGRISQVNLWNRVLQPDEALVVAQPCVREHPGVMKSWADIKGGLVGTLYETAPSWLSSGPQTSCKRG